MRTIIQNFTLISLTSTATPHPAGLRFRTIVSFHPMHLTIYLTSHCLRSWKIFPAVETICVLPTSQGMRLLFLKHYWMAWSLSGWLDAIKLAPPLCRRQPRHRYLSGLRAR